MRDVADLLREGKKKGLLDSSADNIESLLVAHPEDYERASIAELAVKQSRQPWPSSICS